MFDPRSTPRPARAGLRLLLLPALIVSGLLGGAAPRSARAAQVFAKEIKSVEHPRVRVVNPAGRVTLTAAPGQESVVTLKAEAAGRAVAEKEMTVTSEGGFVLIEVAPPTSARAAAGRVDLTVRVPLRSKVEIVTTAGAIDVIGDVAEATASTDTGTIRADVPSTALSYKFTWTASRPRYLSELELAEVRERAGGKFEISGRLGEKKKAPEGERVRLDFLTERGVVLLGVDPEMVPSDLRERQLTEAARAIVRSGNEELAEAVRKVSPRLFREYVRELPPPKGAAPTLVSRASSTTSSSGTGATTTTAAVRLNVNVTDRLGRAISGLTAHNFQVYEGNERKEVTRVEPSSAPFNLVLLLDVSGSVEERLDFIRKAARNFVRTVSPQDRLAVISFRDDVQVVSDFTTDRTRLLNSIDQIEAGGATAVYDALTYVLLETLRPLRGERTAIVLLSDGDDNRSFVPFPALLETVIESGAILYPLYVPSGLIPETSAPQAAGTADPIRTRYLTLTTRAETEGSRLAQESGGIFYPIRRIDDLQQAYDDIIAQLRTSYTITYKSERPEEEAARGGARRVRVRVDRENAAVRLSPAVNVAVTN